MTTPAAIVILILTLYFGIGLGAFLACMCGREIREEFLSLSVFDRAYYFLISFLGWPVIWYDTLREDEE